MLGRTKDCRVKILFSTFIYLFILVPFFFLNVILQWNCFKSFFRHLVKKYKIIGNKVAKGKVTIFCQRVQHSACLYLM